MDPITRFNKERKEAIKLMGKDNELKKKSLEWIIASHKYNYHYNFTWLGRPIIHYPNDVMLLQEIIWDIKPDLIIETGIAHGGSIVFSASMLELIGKGEVVAVDIEIRKHNRIEIENHPMYKRITLIEGSSVDSNVIKRIESIANSKKRVMVFLDSLHTHDHVLKELRQYSKFVTKGSYIVCFDTYIKFFPKGYFKNKPWSVNKNPMTAVKSFLKENDSFMIDNSVIDKLCITEAFDGYLKRIR